MSGTGPGGPFPGVPLTPGPDPCRLNPPVPVWCRKEWPFVDREIDGLKQRSMILGICAAGLVCYGCVTMTILLGSLAFCNTTRMSVIPKRQDKTRSQDKTRPQDKTRLKDKTRPHTRGAAAGKAETILELESGVTSRGNTFQMKSSVRTS
ncbi:unnamed protein product, partial [Cyprideis torosa]